MKKWLIIGGILLVIAGGAGFWYQGNYGTVPYYTKVANQGTRVEDHFDNGDPANYYRYQQATYSEKGTAKELTFTTIEDKPLKMGAYLKIGYNENHQEVINWEEVSEQDVPKAALEKLAK